MSDWDGKAYDEVAAPQEEWGLKVLERLELSGTETVLDAGCGSGRLTAHLLERLPEGRVIGVDASPSMIEAARGNLGDRAELVLANMLDLELAEPVDAIFSNAAFHWVPEHDRLFARMHSLLRPGGVLEAQCGGQGNVAELESALLNLEGDERFAPYLRTLVNRWNFASLADTESRLERAGFRVDSVWLNEEKVIPADPRAFVVAACLANHLERLPEDLREEFVDTLLDILPRPLTLEYVRLNISAERPA